MRRVSVLGYVSRSGGLTVFPGPALAPKAFVSWQRKLKGELQWGMSCLTIAVNDRPLSRICCAKPRQVTLYDSAPPTTASSKHGEHRLRRRAAWWVANITRLKLDLTSSHVCCIPTGVMGQQDSVHQHRLMKGVAPRSLAS